MKITGTSSYVEIETNGKVAKIKGELLANGFVAWMDTFEHWEPPFEKTIVTEEEKTSLIRDVEKENKNSTFKVFFE